jgi:hypothetical protein
MKSYKKIDAEESNGNIQPAISTTECHPGDCTNIAANTRQLRVQFTSNECY